MSKLVVTLTNKVEDKDLVFDIYDTAIANKWKDEIIKQPPLHEVNRFQGWPSSGKTVEHYKQELKKIIDIVNDYRSDTIQQTSINSQQELNYLHTFFENLRGTSDKGTEFYNQAPEHVKNAVDNFNKLIHECEHTMRDNDPTIVVTFNDKHRYPLADSDYEHFTFKWKYGEVYINYCEVGKPLLDIFKDKDEMLGTEAIKPQSLYSADFMVKFGPTVPDDFYNKRLNEFEEWYAEQAYYIKNRALGMIPVAILEKGEPYPHFTEVKSVCVR